jgi:hypothetical protein
MALPYFATGEVVGDYELLYRYWRYAGRRAEEATLRREDFDYLRRLVEDYHVKRLDELLAKLTDYFSPRVDPEAARRAVEDHYKVSIPPEDARRMVARILAGWLVEAGQQWKILRLRGWTEHGWT